MKQFKGFGIKTMLMLFIFILLMVLLCSCGIKGPKEEENEAIAETFIKVWSDHNTDRLITLFADSCLYEEVATGRSYSTKEAISEYIDYTLKGVPDSKFEIVSLFACKDMASIEWIWSGTNSVGWEDMGLPATNQKFEIRGVSVMKIEDRMIVRNSDYWDWGTFLREIGVRQEE